MILRSNIHTITFKSQKSSVSFKQIPIDSWWNQHSHSLYHTIPWHGMTRHGIIYHTIWYTIYCISSTRILFSVFSFSVVFSSSHVACRISLIALLFRDLQLNETAYILRGLQFNETAYILRGLQFNGTTCYEVNYEVCNSTRERIYYETCNSTRQRVTRSITRFDSTRQRVTRSKWQRYQILSNLWSSCSICMINCMIIRQLIWRLFQDFRRISKFLDWIRNRLSRNKIYSQTVLLTLENHSCTELTR